MHPRPLHRTKTLWFGIFILLFLAWAFIRSIGHNDRIGYGFSPSRWHIEAGSRAGSFTWQSGKVSPHYGMRLGWIIESKKRTGGISFREPLEISTNPLWIEIDYWVLALLFLLPWSLHLVRRTRRIRAHTNPAAP